MSNFRLNTKRTLNQQPSHPNADSNITDLVDPTGYSPMMGHVQRVAAGFYPRVNGPSWMSGAAAFEVHEGIIRPYNQLSNAQLEDDFALYNFGPEENPYPPISAYYTVASGPNSALQNHNHQQVVRPSVSDDGYMNPSGMQSSLRYTSHYSSGTVQSSLVHPPPYPGSQPAHSTFPPSENIYNCIRDDDLLMGSHPSLVDPILNTRASRLTPRPDTIDETINSNPGHYMELVGIHNVSNQHNDHTQNVTRTNYQQLKTLLSE